MMLKTLNSNNTLLPYKWSKLQDQKEGISLLIEHFRSTPKYLKGRERIFFFLSLWLQELGSHGIEFSIVRKATTIKHEISSRCVFPSGIEEIRNLFQVAVMVNKVGFIGK